jgi:hypothetical protein
MYDVMCFVNHARGGARGYFGVLRGKLAPPLIMRVQVCEILKNEICDIASSHLHVCTWSKRIFFHELLAPHSHPGAKPGSVILGSFRGPFLGHFGVFWGIWG